MKWCNYLIQANLYLVLFYAFYWLILRKETFFNLNRYYLLLVALASGIIPLLKINWFSGTAQPVQQHFMNATAMVMEGYASPIEEAWTLGDILTLTYFGIIAIMTIRLIYKLLSLNQILKDKNQPEAFSFFNKIRINVALPQQGIIEKHELAHAKQLHSADILLFEVIAIINWFNPIVYFYKKSIKHIHEFIADEVVINSEIDKQDYALLLLSKNFGVATHTLTNNFFNQSLLKRRIEMMNKTKSRKTAILKYGLSAPLFILALVLSSAKISESKTISNLSDKIKPEKQLSEILISRANGNIPALTTTPSQDIPNSKNTTQKVILKPIPNSELNKIPLTDTIPEIKRYPDVELVPSFPGGKEQFGKYLSENFRYPPVARDRNIQGEVNCGFVIGKDGSLTDFKIHKGIGGGCDEEVVRVLSRSPKWSPASLNGVTKSVNYNISITFSIEEGLARIFISNPSPINIPDKALVIIDGVEYKGDKNKLKDHLSISDVQSISVLKDESATKKYGDKGKDGVIEITTKKK